MNSAALTKTIVINKALLAEMAAEDAAFGYKSSAGEVANVYWTRGLTGDERVALAGQFVGSELSRIRQSVAVLAEMIEVVS